jgi:DNA-binding XRE family transcriptional regulator
MTASTSPNTIDGSPQISSSATGALIWVDLFQPKDVPVPADFEDLDAIVARDERVPARRLKLEHARKALATREPQRITGLSALRLRKGWSQKRLADEVGTSQSHIARLELGHDDILLSTARKLAAALNVAIEEVDTALRARGGSGK